MTKNNCIQIICPCCNSVCRSICPSRGDSIKSFFWGFHYPETKTPSSLKVSSKRLLTDSKIRYKNPNNNHWKREKEDNTKSASLDKDYRVGQKYEESILCVSSIAADALVVQWVKPLPSNLSGFCCYELNSGLRQAGGPDFQKCINFGRHWAITLKGSTRGDGKIKDTIT